MFARDSCLNSRVSRATSYAAAAAAYAKTNLNDAEAIATNQKCTEGFGRCVIKRHSDRARAVWRATRKIVCLSLSAVLGLFYCHYVAR